MHFSLCLPVYLVSLVYIQFLQRFFFSGTVVFLSNLFFKLSESMKISSPKSTLRKMIRALLKDRVGQASTQLNDSK